MREETEHVLKVRKNGRFTVQMATKWVRERP